MLVLAKQLFSEIDTRTLCRILNAYLHFFLVVIGGLGRAITNLISRLRSSHCWWNRSGRIRLLISGILLFLVQWPLPCIAVKAISSPCVAGGTVSSLSMVSDTTLGNWVGLDPSRRLHICMFERLSDVRIWFWFFRCFSFYFVYIKVLEIAEGWVITGIPGMVVVELLELFGLFSLDGIFTSFLFLHLYLM